MRCEDRIRGWRSALKEEGGARSQGMETGKEKKKFLP